MIFINIPMIPLRMRAARELKGASKLMFFIIIPMILPRFWAARCGAQGGPKLIIFIIVPLIPDEFGRPDGELKGTPN